MKRDLTRVIDRMIACIPAGQGATLVKDLEGIKSSAAYTAPEVMAVRWQEGANLLLQYLGPTEPTEGWRLNLVNVWLDRTYA